MKNNKVIKEKLGSKPPKAISKVRHYINERYGLLLTLEQVTILFDEPCPYWGVIDYVDTLNEQTIGVRLGGYIHHALWVRLTGTLACSNFQSGHKLLMQDITEHLGWEDRLHPYSEYVLLKFRGSMQA